MPRVVIVIVVVVITVAVVQRPRKGVQQPDERRLADAPLEQRVRGQRAEGVVADLGVRGGRPAVNEGQVGVRAEGGRVQQDEPDVDAKLGLRGGRQSLRERGRGVCGERKREGEGEERETHHAVPIRHQPVQQHRPPQRRQASRHIALRALPHQELQLLFRIPVLGGALLRQRRPLRRPHSECHLRRRAFTVGSRPAARLALR